MTVAVAGALALCLLGASRADAYIYWGNQTIGGNFPGYVGRAMNDGTGVNQQFVVGANAVCGPAVNSGFLYWANRDVSKIARANLDGSSPNQSFIGTGSSLPCGVATDSSFVYWANGGVANSIGRANLDGTSVNNTFITGATDPNGVAVDSSHIYWGSDTGFETGAVGRANLDGTSASNSFITTASDVNGVAVDGAHIYWANVEQDSIGRANLDGSGVNQSFISTGDFPCGVAVDDTHIYWTDQGNSSIGRANLDGTGVNDTFITGASTPCGVAVDNLPNTTTTTVSCSPSSVLVGQASTCAATVTDSSTSPSTPTGSVNFTSSVTGGSFSGGGTCTLVTVTSSSASCAVTYTPGQVGGGSHQITGSYGGDNAHSADDGGFTLTVNGHATGSSIDCVPASVLVAEGTTCTATVSDTSSSPTVPTGSVDWSSASGSFSSAACTLAMATSSTASCTVTYTPDSFGSPSVLGSYQGDNSHNTSSDSTSVPASRRPTSTGNACAPATVVIGETTTCTGTVTDTGSAGTSSAPSGQLSLSSDTSGGTFSGGGECALSSTSSTESSCTVDYTPGQLGSGTHELTASYPDGSVHAASSDSADVTVTERATTSAVACSPSSVDVSSPSTCTVTVTDTSPGTFTPPDGTVDLSDSGGTFDPGPSCTLAPVGAATSTCDVSYTPGSAGTHQVDADYAGDGTHAGSQGSAQVQATALPPAEGKLSLAVPSVAIVTDQFGVKCGISPGQLTSCFASATAGASSSAKRAIAQGSASSPGAAELPVTLHLTGRGKRLVTSRLRGLPVTVGANATAKSGTSLGSSGSALLLAARQRLAPNSPMFGADNAGLTKAGKSFLRKVARSPYLASIRCEGHTASVFHGNAPFARRLGRDRAMAACRYLKKLGVKARLRTVTFGKRNPRASNQSAKGRALNRYVSLRITRRL